MTVRDAGEADVPAIAAIYAEHVLHGNASFEEVPPDEAEIARRMRDIRARGFPYLACESEGRVVGYAYAGPYRTRSAYRFTLENSVYVASDAAGRGIGTALLAELIERCKAGPWRSIVAIIGDSGNDASIALHRGFGFAHVGTIKDAGFKHGRWLDSVVMQLDLRG